ncbi:MAG: NAD(P)/FAD-dependent oxidoreductase [Nocardioidaceae bacterium]|nr:NAD(P)/FAD-dependent oxidoreductase [Nocardioidaceae bacterium]
MARVVVIGGGLGGLASAARLAKLGHEVTLVEASDAVGGALRATEADDHRWATTSTLLPAVLRDLFRKSGRPLERELDLEPLDVVREHHFADGRTVRLPGGSRAAQLRAVASLGEDLGQRWTAYVDGLGADWELVRRDYVERPWDTATAPAQLRRRLATRQTVQGRLGRLGDDRLRALAAHPLTSGGHDVRRVPAWMAVWPFIEQRFGAWEIAGGTPALADALTARLRTRGVDMLLATRATDLLVRDGRVAAVATSGGPLGADVVVCAVDPHQLPTLAPHVTETTAVVPPTRVHLALEGTTDGDPGPGCGHVVWHGEPDIVVRPGLAAPAGRTSVTLEAFWPSRPRQDLVDAVAGRGWDVRDRVLLRVDEPPSTPLERWSGSPWGTRWDGRRTVRRRLGPTTPIPGVFAAGAHATPGADLPFVGLSGSLVAQAVGEAG